MICTAIFLFCYLFTSCTSHLVTLAGASPSAAPAGAHPLPALGAGARAALKHDAVHKLMSQQDLRRTFQVDSHDQVPEYEILKLTVDDDGSHLISPISDLGEFETTTTHRTSHQHQRQQQLQPNAPPSTAKTSASSHQQHHEAANHRHKRSSPAHDQPQVARAALEAAGGKRAAGLEQQDDKLIVMKLSTFGREFKLRLKRNVDFQQRIKDMKMFMAESTQDGQLKYTEIKSAGQASARSHKQVS